MNFERSIQILGDDLFTTLQQARVVLFGVGGVGGWCAESLIRTGLKHLTIVDFDVVDSTNLNRQVVALDANIGSPKVEAMKERLLAINPEADIRCINSKFTPESDLQTFMPEAEDWAENPCFVLDAIDSVDCKIALLLQACAIKNSISGVQPTLISSMGAARKFDPLQVRVSDFWKVEGCPLARSLRTKMKKAGTLPARKFTCVWSPEVSAEQGSLAQVVGTFGFTMAAQVIEHLKTK